MEHLIGPLGTISVQVHHRFSWHTVLVTSRPAAVPHRRVAWGLLLVAGVVWASMAAFLVPWHPVPGGTPEPAQAADWFTADQLDRAKEYATLSRYLSWTSLAVSLLVAVALGMSTKVRRGIGRLPGPWWCQLLIAVAGVQVIGLVATLPFSIALWRRSLAHGLSTLSWGGWAQDQATSAGVNFAVTAAVAWILIGFARRWKTWWPALAGGVLASLVVVGSYVYPVVVEPLFNDFHSLPEGELRSAVMELAQQEGVRIDDVLVADASRRTTTLNAYVSGFGNSRRVVLYDNLVQTVPRAEVLSVVAHELAHAKHNDVGVGTALGAVGVLVGVGALGVLVSSRRRLDTPAAVPGLLAVVAVTTVLVAPLQNGISRAIETRADVVAVQTTGDADTQIAMNQQLAIRSLADPQGPAWSQWWWGTHPRVLERIAIARQVAEDEASVG